MSKLPAPIWISPQETLDLVVDETKEPQEVVKQRLIEAFVDGVIETTGDCQSLQADVSWADNALNPRLDEPEKAVETPKTKSPIDTLPGDVTYAEYDDDGRIGKVVRSIGSNKFDQVRVRRKDVVRWLGDGGAPAGEDEARATIKEKSKTGGQHKRKGSDDAKLKNRIESVIARARTRWPDPKNRPTFYAMAKALCDNERDGKVQGYGESTVKRILGGTYPAMARLEIAPLT